MVKNQQKPKPCIKPQILHETAPYSNLPLRIKKATEK